MVWPFSMIRFAIEAKKLRKECLEEIVVKAKEQGLYLVKVYLNDKPVEPYLTLGNRFSHARIVLEELKKQSRNYSIEFFVQERHSQMIWDKYVKNPFNGWKYEGPDINTPISEGFVKLPIGEVTNPKYKAYLEECARIKKEVERMAYQHYQQSLKKWGEDTEKWKSIPIEEWKRRNKKNNRKCPDCNGRGGGVERIPWTGYIKSNDSQIDEEERCYPCGMCFGSGFRNGISQMFVNLFYGRGKVSAKTLRLASQPNKPYYNSYEYAENLGYEYITERIRKLENPGCSTLLVYAKITPK